MKRFQLFRKHMHVSKTFNWKEIWKAALIHEKGAEIISKVSTKICPGTFYAVANLRVL